VHDVEALHQMSRFQSLRPFLEVPGRKLREAAGIGHEEQVVVILPEAVGQDGKPGTRKTNKKRWKIGKSPFFGGKSMINGHFQ
jgi:hypothetical protein